MTTNAYMMVAALVAGLCAGCELDGGEADGGGPWLGFRSGDRLKLRLGVTPDGASEFLGWYDTMFDVECTFRRTPDGASRCLPLASRAVLFKDSSCTQPLASPGSGTCDPQARYLETVATVSDECGRLQEAVRVFEVGDVEYTGPVYSNGANPEVCAMIGNRTLTETTEIPTDQLLARETRIDD